MAGPERRDTRAQGRFRRADSSSSALAGPSAAASGSATDTGNTSNTPVPPVTSTLLTRSTYRTLIMQGMAPDEAANLTAFMAGLPVGAGRWTLRQINELLFLRRLHETGMLSDGERPPAH